MNKADMVYRYAEGQTVFVDGKSYEVAELYGENVVLRDSDFPLSTFLYVREDLDALLREDTRNDYLLTEPEQTDEVEISEPEEAPEEVMETAAPESEPIPEPETTLEEISEADAPEAEEAEEAGR